MKSISPELAEKLNPENKALTTKQWQKKLEKYEQAQAKKQEQYGDDQYRPGVCECGNSTFHLSVLPGGKLERTCKNESCGEVKIL